MKAQEEIVVKGRVCLDRPWRGKDWVATGKDQSLFGTRFRLQDIITDENGLGLSNVLIWSDSVPSTVKPSAGPERYIALTDTGYSPRIVILGAGERLNCLNLLPIRDALSFDRGRVGRSAISGSAISGIEVPKSRDRPIYGESDLYPFLGMWLFIEEKTRCVCSRRDGAFQLRLVKGKSADLYFWHERVNKVVVAGRVDLVRSEKKGAFAIASMQDLDLGDIRLQIAEED